MSCSLGGDCLFPSETRRGRRIPVATTFRCCDKRFCDFGCLRKHWNGPVTVQGRLCRDGTAQEAAYRAGIQVGDPALHVPAVSRTGIPIYDFPFCSYFEWSTHASWGYYIFLSLTLKHATHCAGKSIMEALLVDGEEGLHFNDMCAALCVHLGLTTMKETEDGVYEIKIVSKAVVEDLFKQVWHGTTQAFANMQTMQPLVCMQTHAITYPCNNLHVAHTTCM
jgi:hypothetical protein